MFSVSKPTHKTISAFIDAQKKQRHSYPEVGASRGEAPSGYTIDHNRIQLGQGVTDFERARNAIRQWKMFAMPWVQLCWPDTPVESNATVAVLIRHLGFWSLNAARIVYVLEDRGATQKYGFAYGTLAGHAERGEERFSVEYHRIKASGTICTPIPAPDSSLLWDIHLPELCRKNLPETPCSRCRMLYVLLAKVPGIPLAS
jgi:uncharacterized protein (UPF0548 family)